jgi:CIC family chloride channel protein
MLERLRHSFLLDESQLKLYVLAIITGIIAGGITTLFRFTIENSQLALFQTSTLEDFASLPWYIILISPIMGSLLIALLFHGLKTEQRNVGIIHVIARLAYHEGRMPLANMFRQFIGATIAIVSGHSVGREGPSVHLGAASGSILSTQLELPNNWLRILVASGSAAAISASFNTPIAGVIFAMEVIIMEYHIATFVPIILASVTAAIISRLTFGEAPFYNLVSTELYSLWEIPYIILLGIAAGILATAFIKSLTFFSALLNTHSHWIRLPLAGLLVGLGGLVMPEVLGMSYHVTNVTQLEAMGISGLLLLVILKLVLSTVAIGLGVPGGFIGPSIVVGAAAGALFGIVGNILFPEYVSSIGLYAMIGMCAMMAGTLGAPLAALLALLELTGNHHIIVPGMLAIVFSNLIVVDYFKSDSIFTMLLKMRGLNNKTDPISQTLRRISVARAMSRDFVSLPTTVDAFQIKDALDKKPKWIIIQIDGEPKLLMPAADLARASAELEEETLDLTTIPASRKELFKIPLRYSLKEAAETLNQQHAQAMFISRTNKNNIERTYGVLTKEMVESYYH